MRSFLKPAAGLACVVALAVTGCSPGAGGAAAAAPRGEGGAPGAGPAAGGSGGTAYAPYVSATTASAQDSAGSPSAYNLAFVIARGTSCTPAWNGDRAIGDPAVKARISRLRASGAAVRVSFGGESGTELAAACTGVPALAAAYGRALDAAGSARADFDVEGGVLSDAASVARRSEAVARLQRERPSLEVSFTLPVMPDGLDAGGLALLKSARSHGVRISAVDIMTMNYGESYAGDMGGYALASAQATHAQLRKVLGLSDAAAWRAMALTSMIGVNDVKGETLTLAGAARVREFAVRKKIAWVSMWATFRDQPCRTGAPEQHDAATDCSGVAQRPGAFAEAFSG
ncbi:chitinase [Streptomyces tropicalis]|uniref:Chitinase n=1 Tax=Streptomyces tropicalis TaxID=3034234 RepID=A0ABT6AB70_9ACTN|nr:chitinase [Streptomyces tropicalis]MDF3301902.1 chitinase [Streptomyces tropicalis]